MTCVSRSFATFGLGFSNIGLHYDALAVTSAKPRTCRFHDTHDIRPKRSDAVVHVYLSRRSRAVAFAGKRNRR